MSVLRVKNLQYMVDNDSFETYVMYTPPGVSVFPVPLKQLNWFYSITAVPSGKALKPFGNTASPNANNFVNSTAEPLWKHDATFPTRYVPLAQVDYSGN